MGLHTWYAVVYALGAMERLLDYTVVLGAVRHSLVQSLHGHVLVKKKKCVCSQILHARRSTVHCYHLQLM